jgi:serine O-acetyltransferase
MRGYELPAAFCARLLQSYGVYVSSKAKIGRSLNLPHPTAIVIGEGVIIGSNVTLYQSVTLGGRVTGDWRNGNYPEIGDGTVIFAGAVVVGKVRVGNQCVIHANPVVLSDIPNNSVAVGSPARVVKRLEVAE